MLLVTDEHTVHRHLMCWRAGPDASVDKFLTVLTNALLSRGLPNEGYTYLPTSKV